MSVSPLWIEIALHYAVTGAAAGDFPRRAPACSEVIDRMVDLGLLEFRIGSERAYHDTGALMAWINALCEVPMPVRRWVVPKEAD